MWLFSTIQSSGSFSWVREQRCVEMDGTSRSFFRHSHLWENHCMSKDGWWHQNFLQLLFMTSLVSKRTWKDARRITNCCHRMAYPKIEQADRLTPMYNSRWYERCANAQIEHYCLKIYDISYRITIHLHNHSKTLYIQYLQIRTLVEVREHVTIL